MFESKFIWLDCSSRIQHNWVTESKKVNKVDARIYKVQLRGFSIYVFGGNNHFDMHFYWDRW